MEYERIDLDASNIGEALRLCDAHVGPGMYTREELSGIIGREPAFRFELIRIEGSYVGYFYTRIVAAEEIDQVQGYSAQQCAGLISPGDRVGILRSAGVDAEYRRRGLMDVLIRGNTQWLFSQNCDVVLGLAWERRGSVPMNNILRKNGFYPMYRLEHPWKNVTTLHCPECGRRACGCAGVLYFQRREQYESGSDWN